MTRAAGGTGVDVDAVVALVEGVAARIVSPRFRALAAGDVAAKGVDDVVTVVDTEAEAALAEGLDRILPGVPVVGEEASAADPSVLRALTGAPRAWVVDPLDGTRAFVEGSPDHAVMVALVERGTPVVGVICLPAHGRTYAAERGAGAWVDGLRLSRPAPDPEALRGAVAVWGMGADVRERVEAACPRIAGGATTPQRLWSGWEYSRLASGERDFLCYWRTSPWDHAPGAVIVREVGGVSRAPTGEDYLAVGRGGPLIAAADEATWRTVQDVLTADLLG
ncbi:inositol monophosphatase family protein [Cellulomonas carbonis]|uniref:Inositol monophosphatase n=1 Tax=Cellulomonas carbonis T26 TaxID=947969 RepID=A0A0A0BQI5_9CELL|nr:inositol monophosphatase family protein [Cellulomonas carbonis]KGM09927.1 inositol monophosphatase [Cellulomonas carbonis T26]GGC10370.1 inositol monophosphatase [Cellulomonas carbonis]